MQTLFLFFLILIYGTSVTAQTIVAGVGIKNKKSVIKYGFIDLSGKTIVPPSYDGIYDYHNGEVLVSKDNKFGIIDIKGNTIIEIKYANLDLFEDGLAKVFVGETENIITSNKYGYINRQGEFIIPPRYIDAKRFSEGLAAVKYPEPINRWGFIDKFGQEKIPAKYFEASDFINGVALVRGKYEDEYQYININGTPITEKKFRHANLFSEDGGAKMVYDNKCFGRINLQGEIIFCTNFNSIEIHDFLSFKDGLAPASFDNNGDDLLWGFIDSLGKIAIPPSYLYVRQFSDGLALVGKSCRNEEEDYVAYGFIDKSNGFVIPPVILTSESEIGSFCEGLAFVKNAKGYGYIDKSGNFAIQPKYSSASDFTYGLARVSNDTKFGYINPKGAEVIKLQFDDASFFFDVNGKGNIILFPRQN